MLLTKKLRQEPTALALILVIAIGFAFPAACVAGQPKLEETIVQEDTELQKTLDNLREVVISIRDNRKIDGVTALAILLIASFLVDRVSAFVLMLLSLNKTVFLKHFPDPEDSSLDKRDSQIARIKRVGVYYFLAVVVAFVLLYCFGGKLELLTGLGFEGLDETLDRYLTGLIIVIGAERVAQWLQLPGTPGAQAATQPVAVSGEMTLQDRRVEPS